MFRTTPVFRASDHPDHDDPETAGELAELFGLFAWETLRAEQSGFAILARSPRLTRHLVETSRFIASEMAWCQRHDLRELLIQTVNQHLACSASFHAHLGHAQQAGISAEQQAAIPFWATSPLFDDEQRLVIEYTIAVASSRVDDALFARVCAAFGEQGAIEFTTAVGWWVFWAAILNTLQTRS